MILDKPSDLSAPVDFEHSALTTIRRYCGWHIFPIVSRETVRVETFGIVGWLRLPSLKVAEVHSVDYTTPQGRSTSLTGYTCTEDGILQLPSNFQAGTFTVTLTHGYEVAHVQDVVNLVKRVAQRAQSSAPGISAQAVNGASVNYATVGGAPVGGELLNIEKELLKPYVVPHNTIMG